MPSLAAALGLRTRPAGPRGTFLGVAGTKWGAAFRLRYGVTKAYNRCVLCSAFGPGVATCTAEGAATCRVGLKPVNGRCVRNW